MRLYGFTPQILFGLVSRPTITPQIQNNVTGLYEPDYNFNSNNCTFDAAQQNLGCYAFLVPCQASYIKKSDFPTWLSTLNSAVDLRGVYSNCTNGTYYPQITFPTDVLNTYSHISKNTVKYTT